MSFNGSVPMNKRARTDVRADTDGYKKSESNQGDDFKRKRPENPENCVLLYTIFNPVYPITTDVIYTISSPSGPVLRIVIFKKTGVQAMVEFDSIESAKRAKETLNGADIYSGCCTLKIEFAKPTRLNVHKNDAESWDYTLTGGDNASRPPPLLQEPRFGSGPQPYRSDITRGGFGGSNDRFNGFAGGNGAGGGGGGGGGFANQMPPSGDRFSGDRFKGGDFGGRDNMMAARGPGYGMPPSSGQPATGCVMMVYGLDMQRVNCDRLFNLFCLYGNVARIKFLKTKEGSAMIQMGDGLAVERCVQYLNNSPLFGADSNLQLGFSKQPFLADVPNPYTLPDGTLSFKDYIGSKHNRFSNPAQSVKNRVQAPSRILHFFNTPPTIDENTLMTLFNDKDLVPPSSIKIFPMKSERSSSGLLEFDEVQQAMEALLILNHVPVDNPNGKFPYTMKLCFSSVRQTGQNGSTRHDD